MSDEQIRHLYSIESDNLIDAFNEIDDYVDFHSALKVNREDLDKIKRNALASFGINPLSNQLTETYTSEKDSISSIPESFRGEIIAIYW